MHGHTTTRSDRGRASWEMMDRTGVCGSIRCKLREPAPSVFPDGHCWRPAHRPWRACESCQSPTFQCSVSRWSWVRIFSLSEPWKPSFANPSSVPSAGKTRQCVLDPQDVS